MVLTIVFLLYPPKIVFDELQLVNLPLGFKFKIAFLAMLHTLMAFGCEKWVFPAIALMWKYSEQKYQLYTMEEAMRPKKPYKLILAEQ